MNKIDLTNRQQLTLVTLINLYQDSEEPITSKRLATEINRDAGTLRNQMQALISLQLAEGVPGPKGGYKPTEAAFNSLDRDRFDNSESVILAQNYTRIDTTVDKIRFTNIHHPELCRAHIRFLESLQNVTIGDEVVIGPTPVADLVVAGVIIGNYDVENNLIIDVAKLDAPLQHNQR